MSVKHININNGAAGVGASFRLSPGGTISFSVARETKRITIETSKPEKLYDKAYEKLLKAGYRFVRTINNTAPNNDGLVMLDGDKCLSWQHTANGIVLYDLCPACSSCDMYAELIRKLEQCKIAINMLKDVNLYDNQTLLARKSYLEGQRAELPETCAAAPLSAVTPLFSSELLKQYTTMVHMWNYIVTTMGTYNEVIVSPDSPSGVSARTAYAVANCSALDNLSVDVSIQPVQLATGIQPLSLFVAKYDTSFLPADKTPSGFPEHATVSGSGTTKTVHASFGAVASAGTYVLTATFLPFVYAEPVQADGHTTYSISTNDSPTYEDYGRCVGYPTQSIDARCTWRVSIVWTMSVGADEKRIVRTYDIKTAAPRAIRQQEA